MTTGERLKSLRKKNNVTQKAIADTIGVKEVSYQRFEYGTIRPSLETLSSLANYFDVPIDYLVGRGIYAKADAILNHWDIFRDALTDMFGELYPAFVSVLDASAHLPDIQKLQLLDSLIADIEFSDDGLSVSAIKWKI